SGQTCFRGVASLTLPLDLCRTCWEIWGGHARIGFSAIGKDQVYWFAPIAAPAGPSLLTGSALAEELSARYKGFPAPIPDIIRNTPPEEVIRTDLKETPRRIGLPCNVPHSRSESNQYRRAKRLLVCPE